MNAVKTIDAEVRKTDFHLIEAGLDLDSESVQQLRDKDHLGISWKSSLAQSGLAPTQRNPEVDIDGQYISTKLHYRDRMSDRELEEGDEFLRFFGYDDEDILRGDELEKVANQIEENIQTRTPRIGDFNVQVRNDEIYIPLVTELELDKKQIPVDFEDLKRYPTANYIQEIGSWNRDGFKSFNLAKGPWLQIKEENVASFISSNVAPPDTYHLESIYFDSEFLYSENEGIPVYELHADGHPVPHLETRPDQIPHKFVRENSEPLR